VNYKERINKLNECLSKYNYREANCCLNCKYCNNVGIDEDAYECSNDKMKIIDGSHVYYPSIFNGICNLWEKEQNNVL
jgi:hypothetical protein